MRLGRTLTYNPWDHYVQPLLSHGPRIIKERPDITIRIFLANDLSFLIPELEPFAEVVLMKGSSDRSAPGMLWRFLPLETGDMGITVLDADLTSTAPIKHAITEKLPALNLGSWRVPCMHEFTTCGKIIYRTFAGCYWGSRVRLRIKDLLFAFRVLQSRNLLAKTGRHPRYLEELELFGSNWPDYGSDEYFKNLVLYPRLAQHGILSVMGKPPKSYFLPLDIEYLTWANRNSVVDYALSKTIALEPKRDSEGKEIICNADRIPSAELAIGWPGTPINA